MKPPSSQTSIKTSCFVVVLLYSSINVSKWKTCCGTRTFIIFCQICNCSVTMNVNLKKTKPEYIQFYTYHNYKNRCFKTRIAKHKTILLLGFKRHFDPSWLGNNWIGIHISLFWLKFTFANSTYALKLNFYHISEFLSFFPPLLIPFFRLVPFIPHLPSLLRDTWQLYIHSLFTGDSSISVQTKDKILDWAWISTEGCPTVPIMQFFLLLFKRVFVGVTHMFEKNAELAKWGIRYWNDF